MTAMDRVNHEEQSSNVSRRRSSQPERSPRAIDLQGCARMAHVRRSLSHIQLALKRRRQKGAE
jgi:hypothetical protein